MPRKSAEQQLHARRAPAPPPRDMHHVVTGFSDAELARMRQAALDQACGLVLAAPAKKRGQSAEGEEYLGEHPTEWGTFHLYRRAPDPSMFRLLVEQNMGRPGSRDPKRVDPIIVVRHCVPNIADTEEEADPKLKAAADRPFPPMAALDDPDAPLLGGSPARFRPPEGPLPDDA